MLVKLLKKLVFNSLKQEVITMSHTIFTASILNELPSKTVDSAPLSLPSTELSARSDDVHTFQSALYDDPVANKIIGQVDHISNSIAEKKLMFEKSLKKATETHDPADMINTARALSEYSLHTSIVTKAAQKSSQAIQKLISPQ